MEVLIDNENGKLSVEWHYGVPLLHLEVYKWSHTLLKTYFLPMWTIVLEYLKSEGAPSVCAVIKSDDYKIAKFHKIMGMHEAYNDGEMIINRRWL